MSSEKPDESGTDAAGDVEKSMWCLDAGLGTMFEATHHCCRGVATCSVSHCWFFLLTAPWKREDTHARTHTHAHTYAQTRNMQLSTFGKQINSADYHLILVLIPLLEQRQDQSVLSALLHTGLKG